MNLECPRCGGTEFYEIECGPDGYDDDIVYTSDKCKNCGLWYDGWSYKWLVDVDSWGDAAGADVYEPITKTAQSEGDAA